MMLKQLFPSLYIKERTSVKSPSTPHSSPSFPHLLAGDSVEVAEAGDQDKVKLPSRLKGRFCSDLDKDKIFWMTRSAKTWDAVAAPAAGL